MSSGSWDFRHGDFVICLTLQEGNGAHLRRPRRSRPNQRRRALASQKMKANGPSTDAMTETTPSPPGRHAWRRRRVFSVRRQKVCGVRLGVTRLR